MNNLHIPENHNIGVNSDTNSGHSVCNIGPEKSSGVGRVILLDLDQKLLLKTDQLLDVLIADTVLVTQQSLELDGHLLVDNAGNISVEDALHVERHLGFSGADIVVSEVVEGLEDLLIFLENFDVFGGLVIDQLLLSHHDYEHEPVDDCSGVEDDLGNSHFSG